MIQINRNLCCGLKGIVYHNDDVIGIIDNAESFLDMLCQIKEKQEDGYKMEVDVEVAKGIKRTFVYSFTKDGKMIPSFYPNVALWTDVLNQKLLYLYNFSISHTFSFSKEK